MAIDTYARALWAKLWRTVMAVPVEWYGAVGDGVTDDSAALKRALEAGRGTVTLGPKTYLLGSSILTNVSNVSLQGTIGKSILKVGFTDGDALCFGDGTANPNNIVVDGVSFLSSVTRTSGSILRIRNGHNINFNNLRMDGDMWDGIALDGGAGQFTYRVNDCEINSPLNNAIVIGADGTLPQDVYISESVCAGAAENGILLKNVSGLWLTNLELLGCKNGLNIYPDTGKSVQFVFATNVVSDTNDNDAVVISSNGGRVQMLYFNGAWAASSVSGNGVNVDGTGGDVSHIYFYDSHLTNNTQCGAKIQSADNVYFKTVDALGNSASGLNNFDAIRFVSGSGFGVSGLTVGPVPNLGTNNTRYGVVFESGTDYISASEWGVVTANTGRMLDLCPTNNKSFTNIGGSDEFAASFKKRVGDYRVEGRVVSTGVDLNEADAYVSPASGDTIHTKAGTNSGTNKYTGDFNQNVLIDNGSPLAVLTIRLPPSIRGRTVTYSSPSGVTALTVQNETGGTSDIRNPSGLSGRLSGGGVLRMKCMFDTLIWVEC